MESFTVRTAARAQFVNVTAEVAGIVARAPKETGACLVQVPHTTCGVTVNENADPDVPADILAHLDRLVPRSAPFLHCEGNSDAHIKASMMGCAVVVPVTGARLVLGTWQAVFLCEFDGPRTRHVQVTLLAGVPS